MGNTLQTPPPPSPQEQVTTVELHSDEDVGLAADDEDGGGEESFTCEICIEPTTKKLTAAAAVTSCAHHYCVDCMAKYVKVKIEDDNEPHVKCPAPNCNRTLDPAAWAPLVGPAVFVRWCDALCRSALSGADTCYCPYTNCSELLFSDCRKKNKGNSNKRQCPMCKRWLCFACQKAWHAGFGCADAPTDGADVAFGELAERMTWKRCPNCRHFVELRDGCSLVSCRCRIAFCYRCGKKFEWGLCDCDKSLSFESCLAWSARVVFVIFIAILFWSFHLLMRRK